MFWAAHAQVVSVQEGDAFVSFYPAEGNVTRVSAGVDAAEAAPIIGRQWFSWAPTDGGNDHYRWAVAPARTFYRNLEVRTEVLYLKSWKQR